MTLRNGYVFNYRANNIKNKGKSAIIFKSLAITFSILIIIMFAGAMTGGFFGNVGRHGFLSFAAKDYYSLRSGYYDNLSAAQNAANSIKVRGGAGYVHHDKTYMVLAALYKDKDSANKVATRMGAGFSVYKISLATFRLPSAGDSAKDAKVKTAVNLFYTVFDGLYDVYIQLDGGEIDEVLGVQRIAALRQQALKAKLALEGVGNSDHALIMLRAELLSLSVNLQLLEDDLSSGFSLTVNVKYCLIKLVLNLRSFILEVR